MSTQTNRINRYSAIIAIAWTAFMLCSFAWYYYLQKGNDLEIARAQARVAFEKDSLYRQWAGSHGEMYVPVTKQTVPSPDLSHVPERDITTPSGRPLTLVNPAWMMRQVYKMAGTDKQLVQGHITSLDAKLSENAPDAWEKEALLSFGKGVSEASQVQEIKGRLYVRVMRPLATEQGCLTCHAAQGYKAGDVRGGLSISVPVDAMIGDTNRVVRGNAVTHGMIWFLGVGMIFFGRRTLARSANEVQQSEQRYRTVADYTSDWEYWVAPDGRFEYISPSCKAICGYAHEEFYQDRELLTRIVHPEDSHLYCEHIRTAYAGHDVPMSLDFRIITCSGETRWISHVCRTVYDSDGNSCGRRASNRDITERKLAEEALCEQTVLLEQEVDEHQTAKESLQQQAVLLEQEIADRIKGEEILRQSEEKFARAFHLAPLIFTISSLENGTFLEVNNKFLELTGYSFEEVIGKTSLDLGVIGAENRRNILETLDREARVPGINLPLYTKDGHELMLAYFAEVITVNGQQRLLSIAMDITEHRRLEEQLRHSQKLEAIGQLAGGIAHDFNNKLTVILGYAELSGLATPAGGQVSQYLREIVKAGEHSRDITRQLLTFSRRQTATPRPLDLNSVLNQTRKTLAHLIGEDIVLNFETEPHLWITTIDPAQIDQIIMNLAVNARDAMPEGGDLSITTSNTFVDSIYCREHAEAQPGEYVQLNFRDTGIGMDRKILEHIFEPFFTTKETGKGTGLGLATVYGIVKQNNGFINVYSEPGHGTIFKIFLPRSKQRVAPELSQQQGLAMDTGTVLLVEDDEAVRNMTFAMLCQIGYTVLVATNPQDAVEICRDTETVIDIILSDVIMPGMSSKEMMEKIELLRPGIKVLYMSGYTKDLFLRRGTLQEETEFIQKPFDMISLHRKMIKTVHGIMSGAPS